MTGFQIGETHLRLTDELRQATEVLILAREPSGNQAVSRGNKAYLAHCIHLIWQLCTVAFGYSFPS